jgi:Zn finger protein HypA/HybF involved in hydrogenase expression
MDEEVRNAAKEYLKAEVHPNLVLKLLEQQDGIYCWECDQKVFYNKEQKEFYCPVCDNAHTT